MWRMEMVEELKTAPAKARRDIYSRHALLTGYSEAYLRAIARDNGLDSGRKKRSDAGECMVTEQQVEFVAGLMRESAREKKGVIMPVECALEIAIDNGIIQRGAVSVGRMQQILAERQLNKKALDSATPYTDMRSLHPNHVHQIDASVCIQYYLKNGKTALIDERDYNEKKPDNVARIKQRITRYLLTDHFSGLFFVKYYLTAETQNTLFDFLSCAWAHKDDERYPFRGVPFLILWDAASAAKAKAMQHYIGALQIKTPPGMPHNPRRQGSVESTQNIVEEWFESKLRFQPAWEVEQLNAWAWDWCIYHNAVKKHTRHGMTRTASWMLIAKEQLRELPARDVLQALYRTPGEDRLVGGNYQISYAIRAGEVKKYWIKHIPGILPGRSHVTVRINPYLWPTVTVEYNNASYEVEPIDVLPAIQGGFRASAPVIGEAYQAQPETLTQQAGKRIENYAYGEERQKDAVPFAGITVMGNQADKLGTVSYMPKRGTAIEIDRGITEKQVPISELFKRLVAAGVEMTPKINKELREKYGDSIDSRAADAEVSRRTNAAQSAIGNPQSEIETGEGGMQEAL